MRGDWNERPEKIFTCCEHLLSHLVSGLNGHVAALAVFDDGAVDVSNLLVVILNWE